MKFLKSILSKATFVLMVTALSAVGVKAMGTLEPQGEAGDDTHKSLKDLLNKLTDFNNTPAATSSPFVTPGVVSASFPTLTEIYALLENEEADLIPANIAQGVTIFGVDGTLVATPATLQWSSFPEPSGYLAAVSYCQDLDEASETDWRLPTVPELYKGKFDGSLQGYNSGDEFWAWTGSSGYQGSGSTFVINLVFGGLNLYSYGSASYDLVCVRDINLD